jgi:hypothetical protein
MLNPRPRLASHRGSSLLPFPRPSLPQPPSRRRRRAPSGVVRVVPAAAAPAFPARVAPRLESEPPVAVPLGQGLVWRRSRGWSSVWRCSRCLQDDVAMRVADGLIWVGKGWLFRATAVLPRGGGGAMWSTSGGSAQPAGYSGVGRALRARLGQFGPRLANLGLVCSCLQRPVGYCDGAMEAGPSDMVMLR